MKKLAILIPCYNEELTIEKVIDDFEHIILKNVAIDIYPYNNNSKDNTASEIQKTVDYYPNVHPRFVAQKGKGNVVRRMFQEIDADVYVMVDADCTYYPGDLEKLIKPVLDETIKADMVIGDRLSSTYYTENKRPFHNFGNKLVKFLINKSYNADINDVMTGYRAFSKKFVKCMAVQTNEFEIETEMTIFALKNHMNIEQVIINYHDRPAGSKSKLNTYVDGAKVILTILKDVLVSHPMMTFGLVGTTMTIYGLFSNVLVLIVGLILLFTAITLLFINSEAKQIKAIYYNQIIQGINSEK